MCFHHNFSCHIYPLFSLQHEKLDPFTFKTIHLFLTLVHPTLDLR